MHVASLSAHTFLSNGTDLDSGLEFFPVSQKTTDWLEENTPKDSIIISSYEICTSCISIQSKMGTMAYTNGMETSTTNPPSQYMRSFLEWIHMPFIQQPLSAGKNQWHILQIKRIIF